MNTDNLDNSRTQVSFIIPHKGRVDLLGKTIDSILRQDFPLCNIEVIIVTQNNHFPIKNDIDGLSSFKVFYRPLSDTISHLRNYGAERSSGLYLAFLDADIDISINWISVMLEELNEPEDRVLISAAQSYPVNPTPLEMIRTCISNKVVNDSVKFLPGRNLFLKADDFRRTDGFPEHLVTCEDYFFSYNIRTLGKLYYTSNASYIHLGEDKNYTELFKKEIWRGQSNLQSLAGRKIPIQELPSIIIPFWLLVFFILATAFLLLQRPLLALICIILLMLPVCAYIIRLYRHANGAIKIWDISLFYIVYFPARVIGTIGGTIKTFNGI